MRSWSAILSSLTFFRPNSSSGLQAFSLHGCLGGESVPRAPNPLNMMLAGSGGADKV